MTIAQWEQRIEELRYNPYHDPTNGRFTDSSGGGLGGFLFVDKGQAGKGKYVYDRELWGEDQPIDKTAKSGKIGNGIVERDYNSQCAKVLGKERYDQMCDKIDNCPNKDLAELYADNINNTSVMNSTDGSYYAPYSKTVWLSKKDLNSGRRAENETELHELGHAVDFKSRSNNLSFGREYNESNKKVITKTAKAEVKELKAKLLEEAIADGTVKEYTLGHTNGYTIDGHIYLSAGGKMSDYFYSRLLTNKELSSAPGTYSGLSDICSGATKGNFVDTWGHSKSYWKNDGNFIDELIANVSEATINNAGGYETLKKYLPRTMAECDKMFAAMNSSRKGK